MEFTYFIARNRFKLKNWLPSMGISTFSELLEYCSLNGLRPPAKCPIELKDAEEYTAEFNRSAPKPDKPLKGRSGSSVKGSATTGPRTKGTGAISQNLAEHGVYVDSTEAMKNPGSRRVRPKKKPVRQEKNVKKV